MRPPGRTAAAATPSTAASSTRRRRSSSSTGSSTTTTRCCCRRRAPSGSRTKATGSSSTSSSTPPASRSRPRTASTAPARGRRGRGGESRRNASGRVRGARLARELLPAARLRADHVPASGRARRCRSSSIKWRRARRPRPRSTGSKALPWAEFPGYWGESEYFFTPVPFPPFPAGALPFGHAPATPPMQANWNVDTVLSWPLAP